MHPRVPTLLAALALSAAVFVVAPAPAQAARRPHAAAYVPPVDASVRDPFRAPACTWCPGNRGLEYATAPGQTVSAAADGRVSFAGSVAGARWVVVEHADGLRTSYGYLDALSVGSGARVVARQPLGTATDRFHFGVRRGDVYLDPALLLAGGAPVPRLVPVDGGPSRWPRAS